jgi:hypothetical protein
LACGMASAAGGELLGNGSFELKTMVELSPIRRQRWLRSMAPPIS